MGFCSSTVASLYPLLYRLEKRGLIKGRWVKKPENAGGVFTR
jgi:DNA-binding PadR family transcriptional regulator